MFYSVVAENGFGVFTEKDRIASVKEYLRKVKVNFDISDYENSLYSYDEIKFFNNRKV